MIDNTQIPGHRAEQNFFSNYKAYLVRSTEHNQAITQEIILAKSPKHLIENISPRSIDNIERMPYPILLAEHEELRKSLESKPTIDKPWKTQQPTS